MDYWRTLFDRRRLPIRPTQRIAPILPAPPYVPPVPPAPTITTNFAILFLLLLEDA